MKGALFDLDGVIADTAAYHFDAWKKLVKKHFKADLPVELEEEMKGLSRKDSLQVILDYLDIEVSEEQFTYLADEKNRIYMDMLKHLTKSDILPGITQLIIEFKKHKIKLALASASQNGPIILEKLGLSTVFDVIVDPSKIAKGKPAPDIYLAASEALHLAPSDCIGIEDSVAGITAINDAGSISIAVGGIELNHAHKRFNSTTDLNFSKIEKIWASNHRKC
ncbi:beta-phosphoglucomutase [uncultured Streptococcus sp.]|uniref:beta-phosphoglucomutase n=1 Tax=uncultured Streptococcus sp. TaxID=83427 RepID=UPI002619DF3D|nr:beta-phosphoglucomutase [uncultured Streptococcus sp.]